MHPSRQPSLMCDGDVLETDAEELQAITRLVFFARASAASACSEQVVYCLDLALQQLAKEIRERASHWPELSQFVEPPVVRQ